MSRDVLIGRDSERAWLEAVLNESLEGRGSLVLLAGEAGVGKTRFAEEVVGSADAHFLRGASRPAALATSPSPPRCGGSFVPCRTVSRAAVRCARIWRCCSRSSARRSRRAIVPRLRGDPLRAGRGAQA